jgi:hypothetical protein
MLELELEIESLVALIELINKQPAPLPWHFISALDAMQDALDNEYERRADAFFSYEGPRAEND